MRCDLTVFAGATGSYSILSATKKKGRKKEERGFTDYRKYKP